MTEKSDQIIVYKVVSVVNGKWYSAIIDRRKRPLCLRYDLNVVTTPTEGTPVLAFQSWGDANMFVQTRLSLKKFLILRCIGKPWENQNHRLVSIHRTSAEIIRYWHDGRHDFHWVSHPTPTGTILCEWVKPLEVAHDCV